MKTLSTTALAIVFLSAGAFAGNSRLGQRAVTVPQANVTVINKNQAWPLKGRITVDPCSYNACLEV